MSTTTEGKDLTIGNETRKILGFAMPMLTGSIFQQLYSFVDSIIVGKYLGPEALGAVGSSFPIIFTLIALVIGIAMGATIVIAQYYGAKKYDMVKRTVDTINIFIVVASLVMTVAGILLSPFIFKLIDQPPEIIGMANDYLQVYLSGLVVFFAYNGVAAVLRGIGDSKTPMYFMIISTLLNVVLDILFIAVFGWGVKGAAVATIISQAVALIIAIYWLNTHHKLIRISFRRLTFDWSIFRKSLKIGLPSGVQHTFVSLGMVAIFWIVNQYGADTNAAYSVAMRIDGLASIPAMTFAGALATFVGQNLGASKPDRAKRGLRSTFLINTVFASVLTVVLFFFSEPIMNLFTNDQNVIEIGSQYLHIVCWFYAIFAGMFSLNGFLRGAGDTIVPMFITLFSLWIIRVPLSYMLSQKFDVVGIWWGIPAAWLSGLVFCFLYYLTGRWRKHVIVKPSPEFKPEISESVESAIV